MPDSQIIFSRIILFFLLFCIGGSTRSKSETITENGRWKGDHSKNTYGFPKVYDFIIIGAGTAGCVMANRLSEVGDWTVLLLEAGGNENFLSDIPLFASYLAGTDFNWKQRTHPSNEYCLAMRGRECMWHHGKAVGGSTVINYMIYSRGSSQDYDEWESLGNPGWGFNDVLPYFLKSENIDIPDFMNSSYHSFGGPLNVQYAPWHSPLAPLFLKAAKEAGFPSEDLPGDQENGFFLAKATLLHGTRFSAAKAFLAPIRHRSNLHIIKHAFVSKILIDSVSKEAIGVEFVKNKRKYTVVCHKEVILSAGVINSPHLLMVSGVGPREHLKEHGIPVTQDLKVGYNLQDHVGLGGLTFFLNESVSLVERRMIFNLSIAVDYILHGSGPLTLPGGAEVIGMLKTRLQDDASAPDIEIVLGPGALSSDSGGSLRRMIGLRPDYYQQFYGSSKNRDAWSAVPILLKPRSRGRVMLRSGHIRDPPALHANYFQHPEDLHRLVEGIRIAVNLSKTDALQRYKSTLHSVSYPGCEQTPLYCNEYWGCAARHLTLTLHHHVGTCKMGPSTDPEAVVDPQLRIYGVGRLRVVDASIMPTIPSGHTMAPVYMIAEKAADMVKHHWGKT